MQSSFAMFPVQNSLETLTFWNKKKAGFLIFSEIFLIKKVKISSQKPQLVSVAVEMVKLDCTRSGGWPVPGSHAERPLEAPVTLSQGWSLRL